MEPEQAAPASEAEIESRLSAIFQPAPEVAPTEQPATEAQVEPQEQSAEQPDQQEQTEDDGTEEFDDDGNVYRLPKELKAKVSEWKAGHQRREDYTRKTQELADLARQSKAAAEALQTRKLFEGQISEESARLNDLKAKEKQYKGVDWAELDERTYRTLKHQLEGIKEEIKEVEGQVSEKAKRFEQEMNNHKRSLIEAGVSFLQKKLPKWDAEAQKAADEGAKSAGYTDGELEGVYDARFAVLSWKAAQFDKLQSGKSAAVASVQKAPPVVKPGVGMGQNVANERKYKDVRAALKKDGSVENAARVFLMRGMK